MAYPPGIQTVTLRLGSTFDSAGTLASIAGTVTPLWGVGADHLVWGATGQTYAKVSTSLMWDDTEKVAYATVPHPTQAGWRDQTQAAFSGWSYRITAVAAYASGERQAFERTVTPGAGDTVIDVDLLPNGAAATPTVTAEWEQARADALAALAAAGSAPGWFDITRYGATPGTLITGASMTAGSAVLTTTHAFTGQDVGKVIGVRGAGPVSTDYTVLANDGVLVTTIASVSGGVATLADAAATTTANARVVFGAPIDSAFLAAAAAAEADGGGCVSIPAGDWVVSQTLNYQASGVRVSGASRAHTRVYYVHTGVANSNEATPCFRGLGPAITSGGKVEAGFTDFTVDGAFFVATTAWSSEMKLLQLTQTVDAVISGMGILNCPATAIGYDLSTRCLITGNTILNAGRLAPISDSFAGAAGSGIGIAIEQGSTVASCIIRDNFITGGYANNPVGGGRTGVHLEGVYADTDNPSGAYIISGNIISGFSIGIRDSGALGTIISDNQISACQWGVQLGTKGASSSRLPLDTIVQGNTIRDLVNRFAPSGTSYGVIISTQITTDATAEEEGRFLVIGNTIARVPGHAIYLRGDPYPLNHVKIEHNSIRDCDGCGVNVENVVNDLSIARNGISGCGRGGTFTHAIRVGSGVTWTGGRIEDNDFTDLAVAPTQTNSIAIVTGAVMTGVRRSGNTDDPALYVGKNNTTTINNNSTLATVGAFSLTVLPNVSYQFEAFIEYSTSATAGLKAKWELPSGALLNWTIDGAGAPDVGVLVATSQFVLAGTGVGVQRVARASGVLRVGATGGTVTLTASQSTAEATDTVITPRSSMSVARLS